MATFKITDIGPEVLTHNLLPLLQPNDVVRLRRVCQGLKAVADDHLRLHVRNNRILHIGERYNNGDANERWFWDGSNRILMKDLLSLNCHLPMSQFSLFFSIEARIFENDNWKMKEFLEKYGKQITHLTMSTISTPMNNQEEIAFYEGLPNLTHLTIIHARPGGEIMENDEQDEYIFPTTFKNLKYLAIQGVNIRQNNDVAARKYFWTLVGFCTNLETLVYPEFCTIKPENIASLLFPHLGVLLGNGKLRNLKFYDLTNVSRNDLSAVDGPDAFAEFCKTCNQYDIKLHVRGFFWYGLNDASLLEQVGRSIVSLRRCDIRSFKANHPNLEYLELCSLGDVDTSRGEIAAQEWSKLKRFEFYSYSDNPYRLWTVFDFLFGGMRKPSVQSLKFSSDNRVLPMPLLENVAWSCFNLKTVKFRSWNSSNCEMSLFWGKLPLLEEICLENCKVLGDSAFIGGNMKEPVFLRLKNLKKLSLIKMHRMPNITDALFKSVIRHLELREFNISSWEPETWSNPNAIDSITQEGIKSLLTSNFARSIERFPFNSWKLHGISTEEFLQLEEQFRSSQML